MARTKVHRGMPKSAENVFDEPLASEQDPSPGASTNAEERIRLPGFGLPVNEMPEYWNYQSKTRRRFPDAITSWSAPHLTVREVSMLSLMNGITDKLDWPRKVSDEENVSKWRVEALGAEGVDFTERMFNYCIAELRDKATQFQKKGRVQVLDQAASVVKSDTAIDSELNQALKAAVASLENVPARLKDWHPGSQEKMLDLVHPSLFPLMYGRSRVLPSGKIGLHDCIESCGKGEIIKQPDEPELEIDYGHHHTGLNRFWSRNFQWLPCEVDFCDNDKLKITSYINNLHPAKHIELYGVIERIIAHTLPLWNDVLTSTDVPRKQRIQMDGTQYEFPLGQQRPREPDEDEDDTYELDEAWEKANRVLIRPEPDEYTRGDDSNTKQVDLRRDWRKQGLQVIVKLANIELRPEEGKTEYEGGSWHIEGQLNEHICASALYYYDSSNITDSRLAFRQATDSEDLEDKPYGQDDYGGVEELYNVEQHGPAIQHLGSVLTRQGRLIAFPNVMQHRVSPFRLIDPTQPGHRKILALFLVDPHIRILSTANVPPQQKEWWAESIRRSGAGQGAERLEQLPAELMDKVVDAVNDWPMSLDEAKKVREALIEERRAFVDDVNENFEQNAFSFCEH